MGNDSSPLTLILNVYNNVFKLSLKIDNRNHAYLLFWINCSTYYIYPLTWFKKWTYSCVVLMRTGENRPLNSLNQQLYWDLGNISGVVPDLGVCFCPILGKYKD